MSKTDDLLDKSVFIAVLQEQFAEQYFEEARTHFRRLTRRIGRILAPEYGKQLSVRERRALKAEIKEEVDDYRDRLHDLAHSQLTESATLFYEQERDTAQTIDPDQEYRDAPNLSRGLFTAYHAIDKGKVVQIDAMYDTHIRMIQESYNVIVDRLSIISEAEPVTKGYFSSVTSQNQNLLNSISLTSVLLAASIARQAFYRRNRRHFRGYQWVSVLDDRTTDYCQTRHMLVWYYDKPELSTLPAEEHPPGHFRCRSITVPLLKGEEPVDSPGFDEWFERQPDQTKAEVLGPRRYELYSNGLIDIKDVNDARGRRRTLSELRSLITQKM